MRRRSTVLTVTSIAGAVALGLAPLVAAEPEEPAAVTAAPAADDAPIAALQHRLTVLEQQADAAGVAAQRADEAVLLHDSPAARADADRAQDALAALAARQTPELERLAARVDAVGGTTGAATAAVTVALSGRSKAAKALSYARKQIGDRYGYAKAGPSAFDCSGLTMRSYAAAHVGIGGHSATAQWRKARNRHRLVAWKHRRVGDLIFYGRPGAVYHVAIYAGHGTMVEAPYPGKRVRQVAVRSAGRLAEVARPA